MKIVVLCFIAALYHVTCENFPKWDDRISSSGRTAIYSLWSPPPSWSCSRGTCEPCPTVTTQQGKFKQGLQKKMRGKADVIMKVILSVNWLIPITATEGFWELQKKWLGSCLPIRNKIECHLSWRRRILDHNHCGAACLRLRWVEEAVAYQAGSSAGHRMLAERTYWERRVWGHNDSPYLSSLLFLLRTLQNSKTEESVSVKRKDDRMEHLNISCISGKDWN